MARKEGPVGQELWYQGHICRVQVQGVSEEGATAPAKATSDHLPAVTANKVRRSSAIGSCKAMFGTWVLSLHCGKAPWPSLS